MVPHPLRRQRAPRQPAWRLCWLRARLHPSTLKVGSAAPAAEQPTEALRSPASERPLKTRVPPLSTQQDGLWAVLCWLSILAHHNLETPQGALVGVGDVVRQHWREFGRNFYTRYDYEEVDAAKANELVARLEELGARYVREGMSAERPVALRNGFALVGLDQFRYEDPVDGSVATKQGVRILFGDGSRIIVRLSGTGSVGATVRIYVEKYQPPGDEEALGAETAQALAPLVDLALELTQVAELTGRDAPTVIT